MMQPVQPTLHEYLTANALAKATDETLLDAIKFALVNNPKALANINKARPFSIVAKYRSQYNRGLLGKPPTVLSVPYNERGQPINKHGNVLTPAAINKLVNKLKTRGFDVNLPTDETGNLQSARSNLSVLVHAED